jgi:hypothetical protein
MAGTWTSTQMLHVTNGLLRVLDHTVQWAKLRRQGYARRFMSEAVQLSPDAEALLQAPLQPRQRLHIVGALTTGILFVLGAQLQDCTHPYTVLQLSNTW